MGFDVYKAQTGKQRIFRRIALMRNIYKKIRLTDLKELSQNGKKTKIGGFEWQISFQYLKKTKRD